MKEEMSERNERTNQLLSLIVGAMLELDRSRSIICCLKDDQFYAVGIDMEKGAFPIKQNDLIASPSVFFAKLAHHLALVEEGEPLIVGVIYDVDEWLEGDPGAGVDEIYVVYEDSIYAEEGLTARVLFAVEKEIGMPNVSTGMIIDLLDYFLDLFVADGEQELGN